MLMFQGHKEPKPKTQPNSGRCWSARAVSEGVLGLNFEVSGIGWEQWVMLRSDVHHDNAKCRRDLELKHLDMARDRDAPILDFGDLFCAMAGPKDPRRSQKHLVEGESDSRDDYYTAILEGAQSFYEPYADLFALMSLGNHETSITRNCGVDLNKMLVNGLNGLNLKNGHTIHRGGYAGWVRMNFKLRKTVSHSMDLRYAHGSGGDAPVTKGLIEANRQLAYTGNVDFIVNGHNHQSYYVAQRRESLNHSGKLQMTTTHLVRTGTYKDEWNAPLSGFAVEKNLGPKPLGAAWIRFYFDGGDRVKSEVVHTLCD